MTIVLAAMGGMTARYLFDLSSPVPIAPISVARLPKMISGRAAPVRMLESRHPTNNPGTAAGVSNGRMQRASESRIWICPFARPRACDAKVSTTYIAAIMADLVSIFTELSFTRTSIVKNIKGGKKENHRKNNTEAMFIMNLETPAKNLL